MTKRYVDVRSGLTWRGPAEPLDGYVSLAYLARICKVSPQALRQRIARGSLKAVKVGRDWLVAPDEAARAFEEASR